MGHQDRRQEGQRHEARGLRPDHPEGGGQARLGLGGEPAQVRCDRDPAVRSAGLAARAAAQFVFVGMVIGRFL